MWEWASNLSSLTVFLAVGALGFFFLLISFLFDEVFEQLEIEHDLGHDAGHDLHDGPSVFSLRIISIFLTALGGLGALANLRGLGAAASSLIGLLGGITLAAGMYYFARFLFQQQASSVITTHDLIGRRAEVVVTIPANGVGQVRCLIDEMLIEKLARTRDGLAIAHNEPVRIEAIHGETVIVSPWSALTEGRSLFPLPEEEQQQS